MKPASLKKNTIAFLFASLLICMLYPVDSLQAQGKPFSKISITINVKDEPLNKVLSYIESHTPIRFAYNTDLILQQKNVTISGDNILIDDLLTAIFATTNITYTFTSNQVILEKKAEKKITISGFTRDKQTGEMLIGTSLYFPVLQKGGISNNYGFYSLSISGEQDSIILEVSYTGYQSVAVKLNTKHDIVLNFSLVHKEDIAGAVTIGRDKGIDNIKKNQVDLIDLSSEAIAITPVVSGNGDIISSLQLSAGVQTGLDGTAGYFVRGGNIDQNQVLLDDATLYNPSHMFNLVSIFNSSSIKRANFLKGGFPAIYGDYLSSVLDVYMKDGNNQQFGGEVQAGSITSSVALHGPLSTGNKSSFFLSARRSTIDLVLHPFASNDYLSNYYFYDINAKLNYQLTTKDRCFVSYYRGADYNAYINTGTDTEEGEINYKNSFGNQALNFRWNHVLTKKIFFNTQAIYSNYYQRLSAIQGDYFAQLYSGIRDLSFKTDLYYYPYLSHRVRAGINYLLQSVFPATVSNKISSTGFIDINKNSIPEKRSYRFAAHFSDDIKITSHLNLYAGVRIPVFYSTALRFTYAEPRVSVLYLLNSSSSLKVAYSNMHQYIHRVESYNASFPAEIWINSSQLVKPQASELFSGGFYKNFSNNTFQASIELYYKKMDNQLLYKGITTPSVVTEIENQLIFGKAWSYGSELMIKKVEGNLTGWISYAFSEVYQQFDSLNNGVKFFPANNRRHNFYLSASYKFNKHWSFSANLFLTSGKSITLHPRVAPNPNNPNDNPLFDEEDNNSGTTEPQAPNNFKLSSYNRLDIGIRYKNTRYTKKRKLENEWSLSVYNVYAHHNTYFAYRSIDPVTMQPFITQVSFIPVIPSLSYMLRF